MAACLSLFMFLTVNYDFIFLGRVLVASGQVRWVIPLGVLFNVLVGLAMACYTRAHLSDPGVVPPSWKDFLLPNGNKIVIVAPRPEWSPAKASMCGRCALPRPERAHHCSTCRTCILRYDHHCPWIDNCVGFHNHKFFLLAMLYGCLASALATASALPLLVSTVWAAGSELLRARSLAAAVAAPFAWRREVLSPSDLIAFYILCILGTMLFILLAWLVSVHVPLAWDNVSTVETSYDNMENPYDLGSRTENLVQLLGELGADWLLPVRPHRPVCDGIAFPPGSGEARFPVPPERQRGLPPAKRLEPLQLPPSSAFEDIDGTAFWRVRYFVPHGPEGSSMSSMSQQESQAETVSPLLAAAKWLRPASLAWQGASSCRRSHRHGSYSGSSAGDCAGRVGLHDEGGDGLSGDEGPTASPVPELDLKSGGGRGGGSRGGCRSLERHIGEPAPAAEASEPRWRGKPRGLLARALQTVDELFGASPSATKGYTSFAAAATSVTLARPADVEDEASRSRGPFAPSALVPLSNGALGHPANVDDEVSRSRGPLGPAATVPPSGDIAAFLDTRSKQNPNRRLIRL